MTAPDDRDLDVFLTAYADDDNEWWRSSSGAHQVWFDQLVDRYEHLAAQLATARIHLQDAVDWMDAPGGDPDSGVLVERWRAWLAGSTEPTGNR